MKRPSVFPAAFWLAVAVVVAFVLCVEARL